MGQSPGERLGALLTERGTRTDLAEKLDVRYPTILRWTKNNGFTPENQRKVAHALGLPLDYFSAPERVQVREQQRQLVLADFYQTLTARDLTEDERVSLESIVIPRDRKPTVAFYEFMANLLRNRLEPWQMDEIVNENDRIDEGLARKLEAASSAETPEKEPRRGKYKPLPKRKRKPR